MKIEVSGKGGCGKSTLSVLMARSMKKLGYRVLLVDGDESNIGIENMTGIAEPMHLLDYLGGKKGFKAKLNQTLMTDNPAGLFSGKQTIDDLPKECIASAEDGVEMLVIGKIHHFGEGCACPMGVLSKKFLASLETGDREVILVDSEAGVEHFGRGIVGECDLIIGVIDPTAESFQLAKKMTQMAANADKEICFVLNKVEPAIEDVMKQQLEPANVIGMIPKDHSIFMESLEGKQLTKTLPEVDEICRKILMKA
ncbi:MAG: P-loop NTPase [Desulfobacteraceae bacterium]|nr:P-loop NTPase [Desulfobacteraceae bacterium]MBC2757765.1 P-loop NTPase [Desulfobacteraceae bacterium]MBC2763875.1 P-loop NTPase [ANME-2 cluster archaeon]